MNTSITGVFQSVVSEMNEAAKNVRVYAFVRQWFVYLKETFFASDTRTFPAAESNLQGIRL